MQEQMWLIRGQREGEKDLTICLSTKQTWTASDLGRVSSAKIHLCSRDNEAYPPHRCLGRFH